MVGSGYTDSRSPLFRSRVRYADQGGTPSRAEAPYQKESSRAGEGALLPQL